MRFPAVFLALIIFAGSRASSPTEEPSSILDYLRTTWEETFRNSELGQEFVAGIGDKIVWAQKYRDAAQEKLQQMVETITGDVQEMNEKVQPLVESLAKEVMRQMKKRVKPQLEDLGGRLQEMQEGMAPYAQQVCERICPAPSP